MLQHCSENQLKFIKKTNDQSTKLLGLCWMIIRCFSYFWDTLTLILLTWRITWAPNNASKWQIGFNSAFKGLKYSGVRYNERCYNEWILQRTVFINRIRMLQRTQMLHRKRRKTIGWRSTRVGMTSVLPALIRASVITFVIVCKVQLSV